jgi:hypothetical protein
LRYVYYTPGFRGAAGFSAKKKNYFEMMSRGRRNPGLKMQRIQERRAVFRSPLPGFMSLASDELMQPRIVVENVLTDLVNEPFLGLFAYNYADKIS